MRKKFQILLTISLVVIFQLGFWSFTFLSEQKITKELIIQVKDDNQVIGEQLISLLKRTGLTEENPETDSVLQDICDLIKLPNGGFICAINRSGNLVAAPGLMPGMSMPFKPVLQDIDRKGSEFLPSDIKKDSILQAYAFFKDENRMDVVASLPISDELRLFVHQNSGLIKQKAWKLVKPLTFIGLVVTIIAGIFTYFTTNKIVKQYESKIEVQNEELKNALDEINEKQTEILAQNDELDRQRKQLIDRNDLISQQNKEITDSIRYAERIQKATLPKKNLDNSVISDHFIFLMPKDVVSGDFYWYHNFDDFFVVAAVDCTGHGVPGAFMSILGITFLNEIVVEKNLKDAGIILDYMRKSIISALGQEYGKSTTSDGMDMAICVINKKDRKMEYAGAYNPVYCIRKSELIELKGERMPIGIHAKMNENFKSNAIQLEKDDSLYLFSDGFSDQFGGSMGRKFMSKNFRELLIGIKDYDMNEQKNLLELVIQEWKGKIPQVDDILVIGLKIN